MKRASSLALLLLLCWVAADYGYDWAAQYLGSTGARWHYVLTAWKSCVALCLVALAVRHWLPAGVALGAAADESLKWSCGGFRLWDAREWFAKPGEGICDALGVHVYMVGLGAVAFFAVVLLFGATENEPSTT